MNSPTSSTNPDLIGRSEYRIDAGFLIGYAWLFAGLFVFGWDPRTIFLAVAVELAMAIAGYLVKAFIVSRGPVAVFIAMVLTVPAFLLALFIGLISLLSLLSDGGTEWSTWLGLAGFFASALYSNFQRFRRTTLRQARFYRYLNEKYLYENGKPVFGPLSLTVSPVVETWLTTGVFVGSWFVAAIIGSAAGSPEGQTEGFTVFAAAILGVLCLLRQLVMIAILHRIYRQEPDQEAFWVRQLSRADKVVLREPTAIRR